MTIKPPPDQISAPIVHKIRELYKEVYQTGKQIPKMDRFGLWREVENLIIVTLGLAIEASLKPKTIKTPVLETLRIEIEKIKHLVRSSNEIGIINDQQYLNLQKQLQEISKMANGWLKYLETKKEPSDSLW